MVRRNTSYLALLFCNENILLSVHELNDRHSENCTIPSVVQHGMQLAGWGCGNEGKFDERWWSYMYMLWTQYRPRLPLLSGHCNRPVFDCLVDAKMEREGAGDLIISTLM